MADPVGLAFSALTGIHAVYKFCADYRGVDAHIAETKRQCNKTMELLDEARSSRVKLRHAGHRTEALDSLFRAEHEAWETLHEIDNKLLRKVDADNSGLRKLFGKMQFTENGPMKKRSYKLLHSLESCNQRLEFANTRAPGSGSEPDARYWAMRAGPQQGADAAVERMLQAQQVIGRNTSNNRRR
ncbi:hypothetical protein GGTG_12460 [Gaeumannomyces tritici R3-111a-1]|uniref:Fungal N-terminal domain-containing protein n=1 Tax=Gaeumannomyces tritici (strain R3-111a-1) TaxID=644352 RepID=J3PG33_GAET3|nr:hypothetical protein GGTG_12460 [Gaeumannomyces tritici R3-111a-1]EJT70287.1 hypothetical protein GGTG_12460 [Gaeumannomyces tritici R3-111a-1]